MRLSVLIALAAIESSSAKNVLLIVDDAGLEAGAFGNEAIRMPNIDALAKSSLMLSNAFTSVSSCSPSRSAILTGLPTHQNGMYGLHQDMHHFDSFDTVRSLPLILSGHNIRTGIVGKKHVGPSEVYPFDYAFTEEDHSVNQVGRNISLVRRLVSDFLDMEPSSDSFFLYYAPHDPHRCGHTNPELGTFCERFGDGTSGHGVIADWSPQYYAPEEVVVPPFVPDTPASREDIAAQYTALSRLDQGIGLVMSELEKRGLLNSTLIIYTSDNGISFPNGRTNAYDSGVREPFLVSSPAHPESHGKMSESPVSLLDVVPTILDWFGVDYPSYDIMKHQRAQLTGQSLLPLLSQGPSSDDRTVFGSHQFHEVTMYYPMRYARTSRYKLIHNINYKATFPIDQDFYISPTFQDMLSRTRNSQSLNWFKTLSEYYNRPEWELFDLKFDPNEAHSVAGKSKYKDIFESLRRSLVAWQNKTHDPWMCSPHAVLEDAGAFKAQPACLALLD